MLILLVFHLLIPFAVAEVTLPLNSSNEGIPTSPALPERIIGSYADGCILGAHPFKESSEHWELVNNRRNHQYGHSSLLQFVDSLGKTSVDKKWGKLIVGDSSCPCGGKMGEGHASHQIGLDVDIFYEFAPAGKTMTNQERNSWTEAEQKKREIAIYENSPPAKEKPAVFNAGLVDMPHERREKFLELIKVAALQNNVDRIFVSPPIKQELCRVYKAKTDGADLRWLLKIRPWSGHKSHFHVRLKCPPQSGECKPQKPIARDITDGEGLGCAGKEFMSWMTPQTQPKEEVPVAPKVVTEAQLKCQKEIQNLKIVELSPSVRCLVEKSPNAKCSRGESSLHCRNYESATTFIKCSACSLEDVLKTPQRCVPRSKKSTIPSIEPQVAH